MLVAGGRVHEGLRIEGNRVHRGVKLGHLQQAVRQGERDPEVFDTDRVALAQVDFDRRHLEAVDVDGDAEIDDGKFLERLLLVLLGRLELDAETFDSGGREAER